MSSKNAYRLINPYIEGSFDTVVKARNSFSAGKKLYKNISTYFTNPVDNFYMTIQDLDTKKLSHFKINENRKDKTLVDFNLTKLDGDFSQTLNEKLVRNVDELGKQAGGKHKRHHHDDDDDDDSSSSSSDFSSTESLYFPNQPINRFVYFYLPYYKLNVVGLSPLDINRLYLPMFNLPINPSLEVRVDLYRYY